MTEHLKHTNVPVGTLPERGDLPRRDWMRLVIATLAGAAVTPGLSSAQEHVHQTAAGEASAPSGTWTPKLLSAEQNEALAALSERLIPGSQKASCNQVIDLILSVDSGQSKQSFFGALDRFDEAAANRYKKKFGSLTPQQQDEVLTSAVNGTGALHDSFGLLKEWIADSYWSSQQGLRELGWTGRLAWSSYPGCEHEGQHT